MRDILRLIATTIIWGAFIAVTGVTMSTATGPVSRMNGGEIIGLMAVLMLGAMATTYAVWHSGFQRGHINDTHSAQTAGKAKRSRHDRIARLLAELEDDEVYDLEALILAREEEARHQQR